MFKGFFAFIQGLGAMKFLVVGKCKNLVVFWLISNLIIWDKRDNDKCHACLTLLLNNHSKKWKINGKNVQLLAKAPLWGKNSTLHRDACKDVGNELVTKKGFM